MASSKVFAYIDKGYKLSDELKHQYRNSLIFIGDEGQIYSPVNDTYIGIGHTAYTNTIAYIENTYAYVIEQVGAALNHIINTSIQHNVNQVNGLEKQVDVLTHEGDSNNIYIENQERLADFNANYDAIKTANTEGGSLQMTNGLAVTSYAVWIKNVNGGYDPANMTVETFNQKRDAAFAYLNKDGGKSISDSVNIATLGDGDVITLENNLRGGTQFDEAGWSWMGSYVFLDDKKTVDYVKKSLAYSVTFTKYWTDKQTNSLYGAILGVDYIPLSWDNLDGVNENDNDNHYYVYKRAQFDTTGEIVHSTAGEFVPATVTRDAKGTVTSVTVNDVDVSTGANGIFAIDRDGKVIVYTENKDANIQTRTDIADGIQTLKEVAYILDVITDGTADDGISLAYNIAKNKVDVNRLYDFAKAVQTGSGDWRDGAGNQNTLHNVNTFSYTNSQYITTLVSYADKDIPSGTNNPSAQTYSGNINVMNVLAIANNTISNDEKTGDIDATVTMNRATVSGKGVLNTIAGTDFAQVNTYHLKDGAGLVDTTLLNSYVALSYNLVLNSIRQSEVNSQDYTHEVVNLLDYNSKYNQLESTDGVTAENFRTAVTNFGTVYTLNASGKYVEISTVDEVENGLWNKAVTAVNLETNDVTTGKYIKQVTQKNGYVTALYGTFQVYDRNYVAHAGTTNSGALTAEYDGTQGNTYNYANLTVEGDIINLSTYTYAVESVTSYGFLADALAVKSYIMDVLAWVDITPANAEVANLNAGYRVFGGAKTSNTTYASGVVSFTAVDEGSSLTSGEVYYTTDIDDVQYKYTAQTGDKVPAGMTYYTKSVESTNTFYTDGAKVNLTPANVTAKDSSNIIDLTGTGTNSKADYQKDTH